MRYALLLIFVAFHRTAYREDQIFTSTPPWGVLPEKHIYQHIVYENIRPDRPESDCGMQDHHWDCIDESWQKEGRLRPTFDIIARMWGGHTAGKLQFPAPGKVNTWIEYEYREPKPCLTWLNAFQHRASCLR